MSDAFEVCRRLDRMIEAMERENVPLPKGFVLSREEVLTLKNSHYLKPLLAFPATRIGITYRGLEIQQALPTNPTMEIP